MRKLDYFSLPLAVFALAATADTYTFGKSTWLSQIGVSQSILNNANGGNGFAIGVVDSGIANIATFSGRVSAASGCAAATFRCTGATADNVGHGTAVAALAAGAYSSAYPMMGVAPKATIVMEKVFEANKSTYSSDIANGIRRAADAGAKVINVSATFLMNGDTVSAVNYAAGKGAVVAWAAGNDGRTLSVSLAGLSAAALKRFVIAGSVNGDNSKSAFSNTPGANAQNRSLFLMAPGNAIVVPYGKGLGKGAGTSFSAPIVAGSIALLETAWPILYKNGTATQLLFATAKDLGAAGKDSAFGNGLLDMTTAWAPQGTLAVLTASGTSVAVSSLTPALVGGGALGKLSAIQSQLARYTSFDGYSRNYTVNLSGLVASKPASGRAAAATAAAPTVTSFKTYNGYAVTQFTAAEPLANGFEALPQQRAQSLSLVSPDGSIVNMGFGFSAGLGFSQALYGDSAGEGANALLHLADGGRYFSFGHRLNETTRIAALVAGQAPAMGHWSAADTLSLGGGVAYRAAPDLTLGLAVGLLNEKNALLGSNYNPAGLLGLGGRHRSHAVGVSADYVLAPDSALRTTYTQADTDGGSGGGLFRQVSPLRARAYSIGLMQHRLLGDDDTLTLTYRRPLRVVAGNVGMTVAGVAEDGTPTLATAAVSLVPTGKQTDLEMAYRSRLDRSSYVGANFTYTLDNRHAAGEKAAALTFTWSRNF